MRAITDRKEAELTAELTGLGNLVALLSEMARRKSQRKFFELFPDQDQPQPDGTTIFAREKYEKHLEFFKMGAEYRERCFMAGNRVGKTFGAGGYETACHLTGLYPEWWEGRRFKTPIRAWAAGKTNETTRDIVQKTLLGDPITVAGRKRFDGTGVIPGHLPGNVTWKAGVPDLADTVRILHVTGGFSLLGLKSYQQGRGSFEGTSQHCVWFDEEPPQDVYGEALIRTATTNGIVMLTFTPLEGMSDVVISFLPEDMRPVAPE